jgi:hypothetical protein
MKTIMLVRLKPTTPHDPKKGLLLKQYTYQGIRFQAGRGWYKVNGQVAAYLESVHSVPGDNDTPLAFDVCTPDEARAMDEKDCKAARQVVPAEQALDVSHVGDEQPRAKSRPGPDRDDALRRQRRDSDRMPENMQPDALDDEDMEDETLRRRPASRRVGVMSRRPRAAVEVFDESDSHTPGGGELEDEARRRRTASRRAGVMPRRPGAAAVAGFDELDNEFDGGNKAFEDEAPRCQVPRRRGAMTSPRSRAAMEDFEDEELDEEFEDEDEAFAHDELEHAPVPAHHRRSLPPKRRAPRARRIQRYTTAHGELDDDDRPIRPVQGARQREALDALRNRGARRTPPRRTLEARYGELPRSRSQAQYLDELHIRHARQMAAKLEETDALDDAMSYGDAEDSLPNHATRYRHNGQGDAEDSLPARTRHNGQGDAEDSLPARTMRSKHVSQRDAEDSLPNEATRYGDAEDSLPNNATRIRHNGQGDAEDSLPTRVRPSQGDAEDSLSTRNRHSYGDAEDSLPHCDRRMQHEVAPSSRHMADTQDDLDAVDQELDRRNVEKPARSDARSQRAQQPPSSAAHDERDALDDALDDDLDEASEDQRPGSVQPQHGQQHTGSSTQYSPEGAHDATSGAVPHDERQPRPDDDPFVNRDTRHQASAVRHVPEAAASASPRPRRRTDTRVQNSDARNRPDMLARLSIRGSAEKLAQPRQRAPPDDRRPPQPLSQPREIKRLLPSETCRRSKGVGHGQADRKRPGEHDVLFDHTTITRFTNPCTPWRF